MSSKTTSLKKRKFRTILRGALLIGIPWAAIAFFQATYEYAILASYKASPGVDILLSETLQQQLNLPASGFRKKPVGQVALRGKAEAVRLFTVEAGQGVLK